MVSCLQMKGWRRQARSVGASSPESLSSSSLAHPCHDQMTGIQACRGGVNPNNASVGTRDLTGDISAPPVSDVLPAFSSSSILLFTGSGKVQPGICVYCLSCHLTPSLAFELEQHGHQFSRAFTTGPRVRLPSSSHHPPFSGPITEFLAMAA